MAIPVILFKRLNYAALTPNNFPNRPADGYAAKDSWQPIEREVGFRSEFRRELASFLRVIRHSSVLQSNGQSPSDELEQEEELSGSEAGTPTS